MKKRILIIEDHPSLAKNLQELLLIEGFESDLAFNGEEGEEMAQAKEYVLLIVDIMLPKKNGDGVCRSLREKGLPTPVLMLTARNSKNDIIAGLNAGADDYLGKPYDFEELLARIRALLRRSENGLGTESVGEVIHVGEITIDKKAHRVSKDGNTILLAPREYDLFLYLAENRGEAQSRVKLIKEIWGAEHEELLASDTVDVHIAYLRRKLGKDTITTVRSIGYMIEKF